MFVSAILPLIYKNYYEIIFIITTKIMTSRYKTYKSILQGKFPFVTNLRINLF